MTPEEEQELERLERRELAELEAEFGGKPQEKSLAAGALEGATRALDYAGGFGRLAAGGWTDILSSLAGGPTVSRVEDFPRALAGRAPTTAEYLERTGVPEGAALSQYFPSIYTPSGEGMALQKGGAFDPTARGAAGFVGDVALDPLTYLTGGISASGKVGKVLKPLEKYAPIGKAAPILKPLEKYTGAGKALYKSAFKNVDKAVEEGTKKLSDILLEQGAPVIKSMSGAQEEAFKALKSSGKKIQEITEKASAKGAKAAPKNFLAEAEKVFASYLNHPHPEMRSAAEKAGEIIEGYAKKGDIPLAEASKLKTELDRITAKRGGFSPDKALELGVKQQTERAIGQGLRASIKQGVEEFAPQEAEALKSALATYGGVRASDKALKKEIKKEVTKNLFSQVDAAMAGGGFANPLLWGALLGKQLVKPLNAPSGRTALGKALMMGTPDILLRRSIIEGGKQ